MHHNKSPVLGSAKTNLCSPHDWYDHHKTWQSNLLHFRTSDGKEVDFVIQKTNGKLAGIEVKAANKINAGDFKGLKELQTQSSDDFICGIILYRGRSVIAFGDKLWAVPVSALWT